jgi:two-component system, chemotaxis family, protein-glutamate methylesterase/glutaminase
VPNRDVIVIGASMGGIEAVRRLLAGLPADLPATIFIVIHTATSGPDLLARAIGGPSALPVMAAQEGQRFARGRVYVPPSDHHLLVGENHIHVRRGPTENGSRPAIDPLFRSAAATCTTRVIGVILTELLNDGSAGLRAIKKCGGIAVVQDPADAEVDSMPKSAIRHVEVDYVCPLEEMPALLAELTAEPRPPSVDVSEDIRMEALIAAQEVPRMEEEWSASGTISPITCPECHGTMQEIPDGELMRYRCHTGHAFTLEVLGAAQAEAWERALYSAYGLQQERAILLFRMADQARRQGSRESTYLEERARSYSEGAELLRRLIAHGNGSKEADESSET